MCSAWAESGDLAKIVEALLTGIVASGQSRFTVVREDSRAPGNKNELNQVVNRGVIQCGSNNPQLEASLP